MATTRIISKRIKTEEESRYEKELIPGLPNDVAELCLIRLPYPYHSLVRTVSWSWNKAVTDPSLALWKPSSPLPYIFVYSSSDHRWRALDPLSSRWFLLPPMPLSPGGRLLFAALPAAGKLFALAAGATAVYSARENRWSEGPPAAVEDPAVAVGGDRIVALGGGGAAGIYDHGAGEWAPAAGLPGECAATAAAAALEGEVCVTEGWRWPFATPPRGAVYDPAADAWRPMRRGMREGWTGLAAAVGVGAGARLVVVSEHGDCPVKAYDAARDTWRLVAGERFPCAALRRPFAVAGTDAGEICVVAAGLHVGIGTLVDASDGGVEVTWRVIPSPEAFRGLYPSTCQLLYA